MFLSASIKKMEQVVKFLFFFFFFFLETNPIQLNRRLKSNIAFSRIHLYCLWKKYLNHLYPSLIFISLIFIKASTITKLASEKKKIK